MAWRAQRRKLPGMTVITMVRTGILRPVLALFALVLPPRCPGCGVIVDGDGRFCPACFSGIEFIGPPQCETCGVPFAYDRGSGSLCGACNQEPPVWRRARAALTYQGAARAALLRFKFADREHLAAMMAPQMARAGADLLGNGVLLVPVPLHRWRLWRRGYNQSALLAQWLARAGHGELLVDALVRVRATRPSVGLNPTQRLANVKGAFRVREKQLVRGRHIVLIDDVLTSGATAAACAKTLMRGGAASVDVLTWARVVRDRI